MLLLIVVAVILIGVGIFLVVRTGTGGTAGEIKFGDMALSGTTALIIVGLGAVLLFVSVLLPGGGSPPRADQQVSQIPTAPTQAENYPGRTTSAATSTTATPLTSTQSQDSAVYQSVSMKIQASDCNHNTPVNMNIPKINPDKDYDVDFFYSNCYTRARKPSIVLSNTSIAAVLPANSGEPTVESCSQALDTSSVSPNEQFVPTTGTVVCFSRTPEGVNYAGGQQQVNALKVTAVTTNTMTGVATGWPASQ